MTTYQLEAHWLRKALDVGEASTSVTLEQKAGLEFACVGALAERIGRNRKSHLTNLESYVEKQPELCIQSAKMTPSASKLVSERLL